MATIKNNIYHTSALPTEKTIHKSLEQIPSGSEAAIPEKSTLNPGCTLLNQEAAIQKAIATETSHIAPEDIKDLYISAEDIKDLCRLVPNEAYGDIYPEGQSSKKELTSGIYESISRKVTQQSYEIENLKKELLSTTDETQREKTLKSLFDLADDQIKCRKELYLIRVKSTMHQALKSADDHLLGIRRFLKTQLIKLTNIESDDPICLEDNEKLTLKNIHFYIPSLRQHIESKSAIVSSIKEGILDEIDLHSKICDLKAAIWKKEITTVTEQDGQEIAQNKQEIKELERKQKNLSAHRNRIKNELIHDFPKVEFITRKTVNPTYTQSKPSLYSRLFTNRPGLHSLLIAGLMILASVVLQKILFWILSR